MRTRAHDGDSCRTRARRRSWRAARRRGVSDVVATILLLGLTVTLFSAIFAFVTRFPAPPAQSVNQFTASLVTTTTTITQLRILQTGGPLVPENDHIYLVSSRAVTNWQFTQAAGIPVAWGTGNSTRGWGTGQYWSTTFNPAIKIPTNLTVYVVSPTNLLFSTTVPGTTPNVPAVVTNTYTIPANPALKAGFEIIADVSGTSANLQFNVSLSLIPGLAALGTPALTYSAANNYWYYNVPAGDTTTNGTYLAFIQGTNTVTHVKVSGSVTITIGGSGASGGGGSSSSLSVVVGMSLQPPPNPTTSAYFWAAVTEAGTSTGNVNVTFWINQTVSGGHFPMKGTSCKIYGTATTALKGPGEVTVYSTTQFPATTAACGGAGATVENWLFGSTVLVTAVAIGSSGLSGGALGKTTFTSPASVTGVVCASSSTTACGGSTISSFTHYRGPGGCTTSTCPYIVVTVTNGFSSTAFSSGSGTITVSGTVYANSSSQNYGPFAFPVATMSPFTVAASSSGGASATTGMTNNRWLAGSAGSYTLKAYLTVTYNGNVIGYVFATASVTVS